MAKAEFITYTAKEMEAIAVLEANRGVKLSAKELGIPLIRIPYWERDNINLELLLSNKYEI